MYLIIITAIFALISLPAQAYSAEEPPTLQTLPEQFETGIHRYYVAAGALATGQSIKVPVVVLQGETEGLSLLLTAAVHGDELNGIRVIHKLLAELNPKAIKGRLILVPGLNQPGMLADNRHFVATGGGGFHVDLNRNFPGQKHQGDTARRFLNDFWEGVVAGRVDRAIDLHTQTRGTAYPLFVFADFRNRRARAMATALMPEIIKNDRGETGTLETTLVGEGIPAVTLEIGEPKRFQDNLVDRSVAGILNVMRLEGMLEGPVLRPEAAPVVGERFTNVEARAGGIAVIDVALMQRVRKGDLVARLFDPFGREIDRYLAPHSGHVLSVATDPLREPGAMLVRILE